MNEHEQLETMKKNLILLHRGIQNLSIKGRTEPFTQTVSYAITKVLRGTGLTMEDLKKEAEDKKWFE